MTRSKQIHDFARSVWERDRRVQLTNFDLLNSPLEHQHAPRVATKAGESVCGSSSYKSYCLAEVERINANPARCAAYYEMGGRCAIFVAPLEGEEPSFEEEDE